MSGLISRQAALRQAINAHKMAQENGFDFKDICEEYLNVLPPVNPQQKHEDVAKAFQLGVAFGFGEKHDEMDKVIEEVKKAIEPQPKTGHCKKCKYFEYDSVAKVDGIPLIVAHEICKRWGDGCKTKEDGYCFLYEPQEERSGEE